MFPRTRKKATQIVIGLVSLYPLLTKAGASESNTCYREAQTYLHGKKIGNCTIEVQPTGMVGSEESDAYYLILKRGNYSDSDYVYRSAYVSKERLEQRRSGITPPYLSHNLFEVSCLETEDGGMLIKGTEGAHPTGFSYNGASGPELPFPWLSFSIPSGEKKTDFEYRVNTQGEVIYGRVANLKHNWFYTTFKPDSGWSVDNRKGWEPLECHL